MAAIITENYRKALANLLRENLNTNSYYIGLGKSDEWYEDLSGGLTAPFPQGTTGDSANVTTNLTDLIKLSLTNYSRVIPNVSITSTAAYYKRFNPYDASCLYPSTVGGTVYNPAYFIEPTSGNVFLVLDAPVTGTLSISIDNDFFLNGVDGENREMITTANGYTIVCIGSINANSKFNNSQFVEVKDTPTVAAVGTTHKHKGVVYGFHIANGGTYVNTENTATLAAGDFTGNVTVRRFGVADPSVIPITGSIVGGKITSVKPTSNDGGYYKLLAQSDAAFTSTKATAEITISGAAITENKAATLYPCISNVNGFKYDMTEYTPAWYICFLVNSEISIQDVYTSYSQVSLIRNPKLVGATGPLVVGTQNMKKSFTLANYNPISIDNTYAIVQRDSTGAIVKRIGIVDSRKQTGTDDVDAVIYYTNSPKYGYDTPLTTSGNTISFVNITSDVRTDTSVVPTALVNTEINTADVLFIDNRGQIDRADDQNEELKIIIQL
jgi:hypothetical protein